jgi:flagellar operon protein (TIGR03826 family)
MGDLMNCSQCGKLFIKGIREQCDACFRENELQYDKVYRFIRKSENRNAAISVVSEATAVPESKIIYFIHQGRIRVKGYPNFTYPCDGCQNPINDGRLCQACKDKLNFELSIDDFIKKNKRKHYLLTIQMTFNLICFRFLKIF